MDSWFRTSSGRGKTRLSNGRKQLKQIKATNATHKAVKAAGKDPSRLK